MDVDAYIQMCEELGTTPDFSQMPVEFSELFIETQIAYAIYRSLPNVYSDASGYYLNKDLSGLEVFFKAYDIEQREWATYLQLLSHIDNVESENLNRRIERAKDNAKGK